MGLDGATRRLAIVAAAAGLGGCGGGNATQTAADQICRNRSPAYAALARRADDAAKGRDACQASLAATATNAGTIEGLESKVTELKAQVADLSAARPLPSVRFTYHPSDDSATCIAKVKNAVTASGGQSLNMKDEWVVATRGSCSIVTACPVSGQLMVAVTCRGGDSVSLREQIEATYAS